MGIIVKSQQPLVNRLGHSIETVHGKELAQSANPNRAYLKWGLKVAGGSDSDVNPFYNPFYGMWAAITRKLGDGTVLGVEESVTREDALRMWTINGAYATFEEAEKGSIDVGKLADLVVLSDDYRTIPEDRIRYLTPAMVIMGGQIVYQR